MLNVYGTHFSIARTLNVNKNLEGILDVKNRIFKLKYYKERGGTERDGERKKRWGKNKWGEREIEKDKNQVRGRKQIKGRKKER